MPSLITCGGSDVQSGRISLGIRRDWWAELVIAADTAPAIGTHVVIEAAGGLRLVGTVVSSGVFLLTTTVRVVGGGGGLALEVASSYQAAQLRDPLGEIMRVSGETLSATTEEAVLAVPLDRWTLGKASAARCLDDLATAASAYLGTVIVWRVLPDGTVWMGADTFPAQAMPDDSVIAEEHPAEGRAVIGCATPSLLPGVDLEGVGQVRGVDHLIDPERIRSHLWGREQTDPIDRLLSMMLSAVGLDYAGAPRIDRLALYRATVRAASADGTTVDVQPESARLEPMQHVPMRYAPGCTAVVEVDAVVLIGWEAGDPARVFGVPIHEAGAVFSKLQFRAAAIEINPPGALDAARKTDAVAAGTTMAAWVAAVTAKFNAAAGPILSAPGTLTPPTDFGLISGGSSTTKIG